MAEHATGFGAWAQYLPRDYRAALLVIVMPLVLTYLVSWWNSALPCRQANGLKRPPTVPYVLPYIGHSIEFGTNGRGFLMSNV